MKNLLTAILSLLAAHPKLEWLVDAFVRAIFKRFFSFDKDSVVDFTPLDEVGGG